MLVLTRYVDETIVIGNLVEIRILAVDEDGIRLAFGYPQTASPELTVTLRINQSARIGDQIVVTAVSARSNQVRIGITAPPELLVLRGEMESPDDDTVTQDEPSRGATNDQET